MPNGRDCNPRGGPIPRIIFRGDSVDGSLRVANEIVVSV